jgi:vacuolar protein sorting-associated protein 45
MYLNFGDLGIKVKELVDEYQRKTQSNQNIETVEDIKKFIENYPEFRKLSGNVSKHVSLMGELSRVVDARALLDVSEVEQDLANRENHGEHLRVIIGNHYVTYNCIESKGCIG